MKAVVLGATGATGKDLVQILLTDPDFEQIDVFTRRPLDFEHEKLSTHIVDFEHPEEWKNLVSGDVAFSCMGTTLKIAGSKSAQWKVDHDYQYEFAKAAKENEVEDYVLVSSYGANSKSKLFYTRMKGALEDEVEKLHFSKLTIFQPGMLERKNSERKSEVLGAKVIKFANRMGLLESQKPLPTEVLAKAMVNSSKIKSNGNSRIPLGSIFSFAEKKS